MPACEYKSDCHTLVQITDSHLFASPDDSLLGLPTGESLKAVVELVRAEQQNVDLILATGDVSQDASVAAYRRFVELTGPIGAPMRWLPGNHDDARTQLTCSAGQDWMQAVTDLPGWRVLFLDSAVPGRVHGYLGPEQLDLLEQTLGSAGERHVLVCLHHHPVPTGSTWLDAIGLRNADEFFAVLDRFAGVRAVLWGHIHQEVDRVRKGVRLLASPSTCIQFAPASSDFALDTQLPGYRWLRLYPDGRIETAVSRLQQLDYTIDYSGSGY